MTTVHIPQPNPSTTTVHPHFMTHIGGSGQQSHSSPAQYPEGDNELAKEKWQTLENRLRAVEGGNFGMGDASDLCLVPDVVIPHKFKVPEFERYKGTSCPKQHLTMYCRKMASHIHDEKLLIHCFQDSLAGAAASWYTNLERGHVRSWKDLADAFIRQYKYNVDLAPDRMQLQNMVMKGGESFKEYAQRWREVASQVIPPLSEKEMVTTFIDTLQAPFYEKMIAGASINFADMVVIGERIEAGIRSGKISSNEALTTGSKRPSFGGTKKKEGEAHFVTSSPKRQFYPRPNSMTYTPGPYYQPRPYLANTTHMTNPRPYRPQLSQPFQPLPNPRPIQPSPINPNTNPGRPERKRVHFDPIPMPYTELLQHLIRGSLLVPVPPQRFQAPFPVWYDPNAKCDYHSGGNGHSTENCYGLKHKVQDLINAGWLSFKEQGPNIETNPLPKHGGPSTNAITKEESLVKNQVEEVVTPLKQIHAQLMRVGLVKGEYDELIFKQVLQELMNAHLVQVWGRKEDLTVLVTQSNDESAIPISKPLVIHYTREPTNIPKVIIQVPSSFPYKDNKAVPWNYTTKVIHEDASGKVVTNVYGIGGMTGVEGSILLMN